MYISEPEVCGISASPLSSLGTAHTASQGTNKLGLCTQVRARKVIPLLGFQKHSKNSIDWVQSWFPQVASERAAS